MPGMCKEAPKGITKLETRLETPRFCSAHSRVTGSVAALDAVPRAINWAGQIPRQNSRARIGVSPGLGANGSSVEVPLQQMGGLTQLSGQFD